MKYQFDVKLSEQDYLDFNLFHMMRSPYGKKQLKNIRLMFVFALALLGAIFVMSQGFSKDTAFSVAVMVASFLVFQIFIRQFLKWSVKLTVKGQKGTGKMGYSPESILEFYDDYLIETMPGKKIEQNYSEIENVCLVDMKIIYIYVTNVSAYMLPLSCFKSKVELDEFIGFLQTKGIKVDIYC